MSRRKQAKPRALKREDLQSAMFDDESSQDTLSFTDIKIERLSPVEQLEVSSIVSDDQTWLADGVNDQPPTCEACKLQFDSITELLDHVNQDCINGGSTCAGAGSVGSLRSSDTPDDLSSPGGCPTPSSSSGDPADPAEITFTVGVTENTPYGCQFCDKAFPRLTYLKRHEQIHSDQMPFRCDYCQRLFKHKRSRDRHVKLHTGDRKYRCTQCESAFSRSDHLKIHMKTHDNGKPYQCAVCNRGYNTAAALSSHMQNHKKAEATLGQTAGATATTANDPAVEKESRDDDDTPDPPKPLLCNLCPQICSSPTALGEHVLQAHRSLSSPLCESPRPPSTKSCPKCVEELASPNSVCPHRKSYSEADSEKSSQECNNKLLSDRYSPSSKLTCGFCSKSDFPTFESLQLHVQVLHLPTGGSDTALAASIRSLMHKRPQNSNSDPFLNYPAFDCDSSFSALHFLQKQAALGDSFMLKRPNDTYCSQCNIGFASSAALLDHVQMVHENVHSQRQPSSPNHSSKRSLSSSRLRPNGAKHLKSSGVLGAHSMLFNGTASSHYRRQDPGGGQTPLNSGQSPTSNNTPTLLCSQCNAGFSDFESFRNHLKSHLDAAAAPAPTPSQQRHFSCPECGAEMSSESQLDSHVASHYLSASTEYGCQSCLKLFSKPDELQKHLMDVHAYHLYRCALCKQMFDSKVSIQVHFAVKHSNECRSLKCTSCSAYFRTELEFQVHVKLAHLSTKNFNNNTNYRCLLCDQLFPNEVQLQYHASTHKKQFSCNVCGEAFHVEFLLDRHMQTVHQEGNSASSPPLHPFMGLQKSSPGPQQQTSTTGTTQQNSQQAEEAQNLCTKKSNGQQNRDQQTSESPPSAPTVSSPVSSTVTTSPSSGRHKEHKSSGGTSSGASVVSLFCAYCNESCKSRRELENHMKSHASPSKHKCNICDEMCPSATTLAEHKLTHCKVVSGSTCIVCRVQLLNEDQFLSHLQQHNSPNGNSNGLPVPCVVCRQTLVVDVEVRMHARFHLKNASLEPPLVTSAPCCVCSRMFDLSNLIIRGSVKSSSNPLPSHTYMCKACFHSKGEEEVSRCSDCGVKFESLGDLESHRRTVHHKKTYQCIKCQMSFETEAEIQAHVTCHVMQEGTHLECKLCHEVLDSPSKLQCHLIEHTYEGSSHFTCYLCASVFTGSHLLQRHMLEHGLDARPYDCTECNQKFFFRAELDNHSFVHMWENIKRFQTTNSSLPKAGGTAESSPMIYECRKCPGVFASSVDLTKHQRSHNHDISFKQESSSNTVTCTTCGMEFNSKDDLMGHMMLIHPAMTMREGLMLDRGSQQDLYQFDEDSQENESSLSNLEQGKAGRERRSFECPFCGKRFPRKEARKLHMKSHHSHSGLKGYSCNHCDKMFLKRSQLKEHMRTHITSTTQSCEICEESFPSTSLLRRHLRDKHNRRYEHTCIVCDELFDDDRSLREHQEEHHHAREVRTTVSENQPKLESQHTITPVPSPEPSTSRELRRNRSSSNDAESNDTVIDAEVKTESVEFKEQDERTNLPAEVAA